MVSVLPTLALPVTTGGCGISGVLPDVTGSVAADVAAPGRKSVREAVTVTVMVLPTSDATGVYVLWSLPTAVPPERHWYANPVGLFVQVPVPAVSTEPTRATPVIAGRDWFT